MVRFFAFIFRPFFWVLEKLTPLGDLLARVYVAKVFFMAGLVKIQGWEETLLLFESEYHVPFLTPYHAAVIGTGAELVLPILLLLGFGGRLVTFIFFMYNLTATISYPYLWTAEGAAGLDQHICWGLLLALLMFHGSGKLSLDYLIRKKYGHHLER